MANEEAHNDQTSFDCFNEMNKYKCKTCPNFQTNLLTKLRIHMNDGHKDENFDEYVYKCLRCLFVTNSKYLMGRHSLFSECATCDEDEKQKRFLRYQINAEINLRDNNSQMLGAESEINEVQCDQCTFKCRERSGFLSHMKDVHAGPEDIKCFQCDKCGLRFKEELMLTDHIIAHHQQPESFDCELCSSKFETKSSLEQHLTTAHSELEDIEATLRSYTIVRVQIPKSNQQLGSKMCSSTFKNNSTLENFFAGKQCPCTCNKKSHLPNHTNICHPKLDLFKCVHCPYQSTEISFLEKHIDLKHAMSKLFQCAQCPSKFIESSSLQRHIKLKHGKPKCFKCEQCPSKYTRSSRLEKHTELQHPKIEDNDWHRCEQCPYKYRLKQNLLSHIKYVHAKPGGSK